MNRDSTTTELLSLLIEPKFRWLWTPNHRLA